MADGQIVLLSAEQAYDKWHDIERLLAPMLAKEGSYLPAHILLNHCRGSMNIWACLDPSGERLEAVIVTQIHVFPLRRVCAVLYIVGKNMRSWLGAFMRDSEAFARANGCTAMMAAGRKGWVRATDYEPIGVLYKKDLAHA